MAAPPPPPKGGMSLYANLLNPKADASASISGAPVLYDNGDKEDSAPKREVNPGMLQNGTIAPFELLSSYSLLSISSRLPSPLAAMCELRS